VDGGKRAARFAAVRNVDGEVDYWRLELTLNELGKAFVVVDQFAMTGERQLSA
jgi:hypothetical protein